MISRIIGERLRGVITTKCYTNPRLPYLTLPLQRYNGLLVKFLLSTWADVCL